MFSTKCPGQDMRYWTAEDIHEEKCPNCGETVEFFKTDIRLRCRNCKTRMANPRFDMGCAEWCAHAEMCLGSGARGIQKKSFRALLEDEFQNLGGREPANVQLIKNIIDQAEDRCRRENLDMLPVVAATVILALDKLKLLEDMDAFIERLVEGLELPDQAIRTAGKIVKEIKEENLLEKVDLTIPGDQVEDSLKKIVIEIMREQGNNFVGVNQ